MPLTCDATVTLAVWKAFLKASSNSTDTFTLASVQVTEAVAFWPAVMVVVGVPY